MSTTRHPHTPLALIILDGWGLRAEREYNAVELAEPANFKALLKRYRHATLEASGEAVGLPDGQMGNSEVGHTNLGAGRIVYQDLTRIDKSIRDGEFFRRPVLLQLFDRCSAGSGGNAHALHLIGLLSDGGVHSHEHHLHALIELAKQRGVTRVFVHVLTDGRDTAPNGGAGYLAELDAVMKKIGVGRVASVAGRYFTMDRDKRWERTKLGYDAIVGIGPTSTSAADVIKQSYAANVTDEFIKPTVIVGEDGKPVGPVADGDSVLFFNFRPDRMRQIVRAMMYDDFDGFDRGPHRPRVECATFAEYDATFPFPIVFPPERATGYIAEVLEAHGLTNLRLAETEKYGHVTYFFNGGREEKFTGEDRILVPSPKVATYDLQPEMSASGVADAFVDDVTNRKHDVIICNFANPDMVGHTGSLDAAIKAIKAVDDCLGRVITALQQAGGTALVTADHGNAEQMWDYTTNAPHTAHTTNLVPVILVDGPGTDNPKPLANGKLCDIAPTMLGLLGLPKSKEMTGVDLRDPKGD